ncbi:MAG TPA: condensation domain-containing protein, partial [Chitinophagaceae bacterium]|nr:condensation domain-containing protein [Chitinophagaceae bacterium]
ELSKRKAEDFVKSLSVTPLIAHLKSLAAEKSITGSTIHDTSLLNSDEKKIIINRLKEKRNKEIIQNSEILAIEKREFYDVSFSQKQALLIDEMTDKFYGFIMGTTVEFQGVLNIKSLQESLNHLIKRHESLRTRFIKVNSEFKQQILDYAVANIQFEDLTHKADRDNEIAVLVDRCFAERFYLKFAPLIRIIVIKKSNENFLILFSIHHIVCDGLSLNILVSELLKDYNLFAFNKNSEDKNLLKFQYKDFAKWQNEIVNTPYLTEEKRFWHSKLSGKLPTVNLPIDFTRLPIKTFNGKNIKFIIDDTKTKMLREFSNKNDSSLFLTLLGIVQILIYRYTNEDDLIIGVPVAGRNLLSLSDKVGFFVNMIPIRAIINGDDTISTHLIESKRNSSEAISFGKYPFDAILEELNLDRDLSRSPIFDIMVSMSEAGYTVSKVEEEIIGNQGFIVTNTKIGVSHDIAFIFREEKDDLMVEIVFNTDLFRQEKIERMCGHFANIVNVLLENEHIRIKNIPIISENEKEQLLFSLKSGKTDYPKQKLIHQQFEEIAKQFPDRIACQNESFSVSYSELNRKSTCLAALIKKKGVVPDDIIVIICNRSIEMIVDILGVLKSGAAYLPVDPNTPIERFEFIIKNSNAKYILVDEVTKSSMPELNKFNVIENPEDEILFAFEGQSFHTVKSSNLAYIIYTSGTSGYPKGVMIEHRNVMNLILCECPIYHFSRFDIWTLFHSFNFDFSVWEIFGALLHGG